VSIAFALDVALDRYAEEGPANVWARHDRNTRAIIAAAEAMGLTPFAKPGVRSVTVTAIDVPEGIGGDAVRARLRTERGVVLGGGQGKLAGKIIRIGTMGDITQSDVLDMLGALEGELIAAGLKATAGNAVAAARAAFEGAKQTVPA
jgi:pyridoxamine--pyruvate transaminase